MDQGDISTEDNAFREAKEECKDKTDYRLPLDEIKAALIDGKFYCIPKLKYEDLNGEIINETWNNMYFIHIDKNEWINKYGKNGKGEVDITNKEVRKLQWFNVNNCHPFNNTNYY